MGLAEPWLEVVLGELVEELSRGVGASLRVVELEQGHFVEVGARCIAWYLAHGSE
jgi:hypothetical protein